MASENTGLIGRDSELSWLRGLVDPPPAESRVLVLLGDAGMGKTVLLAEAVRLGIQQLPGVLGVQRLQQQFREVPLQTCRRESSPRADQQYERF